MPLAFSILLVKLLILVKAFMNLNPKLEDAFSVFNTFSESSDFTKEVSISRKSCDFSKEVWHFQKKVMILIRRCDTEVDQP